MKPWPLPAVIAHRCGGTLAPENTLVGLEIAIAHHCAAVEFDVMLSGRGTAVLIHDETLERTTDGSGRVSETPDEQLFSLDAGSWKSSRFIGQRVPRLSDALERCASLGLAVNAEIKPARGFERATGRVTAALCAEFAGRIPILLSSFSIDALASAIEIAPDLPRALLVERLPTRWKARVTALGLDGFVCDTRHLRERIARQIRDAGLGLAVYTENDPGRVALLRSWGVQSVITDRPDLLAAI